MDVQVGQEIRPYMHVLNIYMVHMMQSICVYNYFDIHDEICMSTQFKLGTTGGCTGWTRDRLLNAWFEHRYGLHDT